MKWMSTVYKSRWLFPTGSLAIKEETLDCVSRHKLFFILSFSFAFCFSQPLVVFSCVPFDCIHTFCICPCDNVPTKSSYEYVPSIFDAKTPSYFSFQTRSLPSSHNLLFTSKPILMPHIFPIKTIQVSGTVN